MSMNIIEPTPSQAAFILKKFMNEQGLDTKLSEAQECLARMKGYASFNAYTSAVEIRSKAAQASTSDLAQREGHSLWAVTGRVPGDDDDTLHVIWGTDKADAAETARTLICEEGFENYSDATAAQIFIIEQDLIGRVTNGVFELGQNYRY